MSAATVGAAVGTLGAQMGWLAAARPRRRADLSVVDGTDWMDADAAADLAKVSRTTIWRADPDDLPYTAVGGGSRRGGDRRYKHEDVVRYRDQRSKTVKGRLGIVEDQVADLTARLDRLEQRDT